MRRAEGRVSEGESAHEAIRERREEGGGGRVGGWGRAGGERRGVGAREEGVRKGGAEEKAAVAVG